MAKEKNTNFRGNLIANIIQLIENEEYLCLSKEALQGYSPTGAHLT